MGFDIRFFSDVANIIIAISAVVGSSIAIWQGAGIRKYNKMCFRPNISDYTKTKDGYIKYGLTNSGPGVALIKDFIVKVDNEEIIGDEDDLIRKVFEILFPDEKYSYDLPITGYIGYGASLAPKSRFTIAEITFNEKEGKKIPDRKFILETIKNRADLIIKYESVYKDKFPFDTKKIKNTIKFKNISKHKNPLKDKFFQKN